VTIGTSFYILILLNGHLMPTNATDKDLVLLQLTRISSKAMLLQAIMTLITGIILLALEAF
jgi:hypothetical protein